ncbi:unnamed protein product [Tetraodon nigroviridis]|uniref:(spotted green pufferfish) hypothetical protein n=1 Tax=Tetraodon nigroviridis TaxID=99883 RepID=Q4RQL0_TETNG|nr:unnamed protein product [Tetraodon nigroviridis]
MMKVRRYLRGSGRVLAFVFVASVVWLLFDMAALRLSINDVNSRILKEQSDPREGASQAAVRGCSADQRGPQTPAPEGEFGPLTCWQGSPRRCETGSSLQTEREERGAED